METINDASVFCGLVHGAQSVQGIVLPCFARGENICLQSYSQVLRVRGNPAHIFGSNIDWLVKNCDWINLGHGFKCRSEVLRIALWISWGDTHIDMKPRSLRGL